MAKPNHVGAMIYAQIPYRMFKHILASFHTILDLGCGTGGNSIDIALDGKRVIGVDNDLNALKLAQLKVRNLHLSQEKFIELIEEASLKKGEEGIVSCHFDDACPSPGDIFEHDQYVKRLPLENSLLPYFVHADALDNPCFRNIDAIVCVNTIHMFEFVEKEWFENMIDLLPKGGLLFLAYASSRSYYGDHMSFLDGKFSVFNPRGCCNGPLSTIMKDLGMECLEDECKSLQGAMDEHLCSFLYGPHIPVQCREMQQSLYIGRKK